MNKATVSISWRVKSFIIAVMIFCLTAIILGQGSSENPEGIKIRIEPKNVKLQVGDQVQFSAQATTKEGEILDWQFEWAVSNQPFACGAITEDGLFTAGVKGNSHIYASAEGLEGKAHVTVLDTNKINQGGHLIIAPQDTSILIGEQVQFKAFVVDSLGAVISEVTAGWRTVGRDVGTISEDGLFTAGARGAGLIKASYANKNAITKILVETEEDAGENDSVKMRFKNLDGVTIGDVHQLGERDIFKISGLPFPLNVLNGAELIFPAGSLSEDIKINVRLSDFATLLNDSTITFTQAVLAGVNFEVMVDESVVSPYYFENPVLLSLPYKQVLLDSLGLTPEDLWIFFYSDSTGFEDGGISNVIVDSDAGRIYADIAHFSEIVIASKQRSMAAIVRQGSRYTPQQFTLIGNYPNPFNPETRIDFHYNGSEPENIRLAIYNLMGQKVRTLYDGYVETGLRSVSWDGYDDRACAAGSGLYIVRLAGKQSVLTHKMLLIR